MPPDPHQKLIASMVAEWSDDERDEYEERAAIGEFVWKQTRANAESQACQHMLRKRRK